MDEDRLRAVGGWDTEGLDCCTTTCRTGPDCTPPPRSTHSPPFSAPSSVATCVWPRPTPIKEGVLPLFSVLNIESNAQRVNSNTTATTTTEITWCDSITVVITLANFVELFSHFLYPSLTCDMGAGASATDAKERRVRENTFQEFSFYRKVGRVGWLMPEFSWLTYTPPRWA